VEHGSVSSVDGPVVRSGDRALHRPDDRSLQARRPVAVAAGAGAAGAVIMCVVLTGLGLSLTEGLLSGPLGRWDESVNDWFLLHRSSSVSAVAHIGSTIAGTGWIVAVAAVCVAILLLVGWRREAGFIVVALTVEVSVFLMTTLLVARERPTVQQLGASPPTSSFPSGHTAAAIALYVGLALVLTPHVGRWRVMRALVWFLAIAIPSFVAVSRVYAGMHHVTDVAGSVVLGAGALVVAAIAVRRPAEEAR
jgi:undecaprenyl-diphosphatase